MMYKSEAMAPNRGIQYFFFFWMRLFTNNKSIE